MKLTFLGTRGYIKPSNRRHRRHTSTLVSYKGRRVMIDCGEDWKDKVEEVAPHAITITHAHPDHAFGLKSGAPCPAYAVSETWERLEDVSDVERRTLKPRKPVKIEGIVFEAFPVVHSIRAPAVGYRVTAGRVAIFYVPDVVDIHDRLEALGGARLYIGDGATLTRPMVRRRGDALFGHTTIRAQLGWLEEASVPRAVFTHCGSEIVGGDERTAAAKLAKLARERGIEASIAHDGEELVLR